MRLAILSRRLAISFSLIFDSGGFAMAHRDTDNLDHDTDLAEALGNMVVAWARAETALVDTYVAVLHSHFNLAMVAYYRIPTFEARIKVLMAMLAQWDDKFYNPADIKTAVSKLAKLARTRNKWIHGCYGVNLEGTKTVVYDFRAEPNTPERRKPIKAADVQQHVEAVRRRTHDINSLIRSHTHPDFRLT